MKSSESEPLCAHLKNYWSEIYFEQILHAEIMYMRHKGGPVSVVSIATGYGLNGTEVESRWGARFSSPVHTGPGAHPVSCTMGNGSFPAVRSGRGVTLTPHPLLVPWSRKSRAIPLLSLWAVGPVQSLSGCTRVQIYVIKSRWFLLS